MQIEKYFTTEVLFRICSILAIILLSGATTTEKPNVSPIYEFYDMKDTRALIFNRVTGEYRYEEIHEVPLGDQLEVRLTNWNGGSDFNSKYFEF
jgi:hypothetical protein